MNRRFVFVSYAAIGLAGGLIGALGEERGWGGAAVAFAIAAATYRLVRRVTGEAPPATKGRAFSAGAG